MKIQAKINYWDKGFAVFDPVKIIDELKLQFPEASVDEKDYSESEVERIIQFATEKMQEPERATMIEQIKDKNKRNGPTYQFRVEVSGKTINGYARRYGVVFQSAENLDNITSQRIIDFLTSLKLGEITSD